MLRAIRIPATNVLAHYKLVSDIDMNRSRVISVIDYKPCKGQLLVSCEQKQWSAMKSSVEVVMQLMGIYITRDVRRTVTPLPSG